MKVKTVIEMDYDELEEIVNKHYALNRKYSFIATEECGNDSSHTFLINEAEPLDEYDKAKIEKFKQTGHLPYGNYVILQDLVNNGALAPGEYLIKVSW